MDRGEIARKPDGEYLFREGCYISEWWNREQDPDASIARARVETGVITRLHRLRGVHERYVILSGTGLVEVGVLPPATVRPGDVVFIPPDTPQRITNTGGSDLVFLVICTPRFTPACYEDLGDTPPLPRTQDL